MAPDKLHQNYKKAVDHFQAGRLAQAEKLARQVVEALPNNPNALNLLGAVLQRRGKAKDAVAAFTQLCSISPRVPQAHVNLGNALLDLGDASGATEAFEAALQIDPGFAAAALNLGAMCQREGELERALALFEHACRSQPELHLAHYNKGICLKEMGRFEDALSALTDAVKIEPGDPGVYLERANALSDLRRDEEAIEDIKKALRLKPDWPNALGNWGTFLCRLDRHRDALEKFNRCLDLAPGDASNEVNRALAHLALGELEQGWPAYRRRAESYAPFYKRFTGDLPAWTDRNVGACDVLVWTEQGLGDQILYAGLLEEFAGKAKSVAWACPAKLIDVFTKSFAHLTNVRFVDADINTLDLSPFDAQASMVDIAADLRPTSESFPEPRPYLEVDRAAAAEIRKSLEARYGRGKKFVGLSWASQNRLIGDLKTVPAEALQLILDVEGVQFVSLQYGQSVQTAELLAGAPPDSGPTVALVDGIDLNGPLSATLNLLGALDLFISVSNTTAHLAGAAGLPVWLMVPAGRARLWYWFLEGSSTPWYRSMTLFRQTHGESWSPVCHSIASALEKFAKT